MFVHTTDTSEVVIEQANVCSIKEERPSETSKIKRQLICLEHEEEVDTRSTADEMRTDETDSPNQKQY